MIRAALCRTLLFCALSVSAMRAQSVASVRGNVVYHPRDGVERQLTSSGKDYDPSLSIDGRHVVFAREVRGRPDVSGTGRFIDESHLYVVDVDLKQPARAVLTQPVKQRAVSFGWLAAPQFSPAN